MEIEKKLLEMNVVLPAPAPKGGVYKPVVVVGRRVLVSGQGPTINGIPLYSGRVGENCGFDDAYKAAELCAVNALSALRAELGSLDRIKRVIKTLGFVSSSSDFFSQPQVVNGCSEFLARLMGNENGIGARSAIGVAGLPGNIPVEIEFEFELEE